MIMFDVKPIRGTWDLQPIKRGRLKGYTVEIYCNEYDIFNKYFYYKIAKSNKRTHNTFEFCSLRMGKKFKNCTECKKDAEMTVKRLAVEEQKGLIAELR